MLSVEDTLALLIWMEIASCNYELDRYRCYIGILVTRPDGGVNEPVAAASQMVYW